MKVFSTMKGQSFMLVFDTKIPFAIIESQISKDDLTFQQMFLEIRAILEPYNLPKIDRDVFLLFLAERGFIELRTFGERKIAKGYMAKFYDLGIIEIVRVNAKGDTYTTLLFTHDARQFIYRYLSHYKEFLVHYKITARKLTLKDVELVETMLNEGFTLQEVCLNLGRKPMVVYRAINNRNFSFIDATLDEEYSA